jgi:branched-chain amino acid transport system ATP-binding protein/branched-chain amino acid transport system permease protein
VTAAAPPSPGLANRIGHAASDRRWPRALAFFLVFIGGTLATAHSDLFVQGIVLVAAVFGILAVSLDLVAGMTGLYSLGHAGLFALGAYGTAILSQDYQINVFLLLPMSIVGVGLVGLLIGVMSLRVSGLYFAVTTFVFTLVVATAVGQLGFTGGPQGIIGPIFPNFPSGFGGLGGSVAWCVMLALLVCVAIVWCIRQSPLYPVLLAIRDAEPFAASAGVRTSQVKVGVIALSACMAGLAGWAFAFLGVVSPDQFTWSIAVNILVMVLLGGINTTLGPLIGAAIVSIYPAYVNISPLWQEVVIAAVFVVVVVAFPTGIVGIGRALWSFVLRCGGRDGGGPTPPTVTRVAALADRPAIATTAPLEAEAERVDDLAVECRGIRFHYVIGTNVLSDVDLAVKRGTLHGLIGPNGSGKSTLVSLIAGSLKPQAGTIRLNDLHVERLGPHARANIGVMRTFQSAVLVNELACRDNVVLGLYTRFPRIGTRASVWPALPGARRELRTMRRRSEDALSWIGARDWRNTAVGRAPHGVHQLTQVAAASVAGPRILILDEPFAGLSSTEVENLSGILVELRAAGVTVILIEHQTRVVFSLCDEVTVLNAGVVIAAGPSSEVFVNERVREVYLGV